MVDEAAEVVVPLDVAGAADDVFERAGSAIVVGDGAGDGVVVVLKEVLGEDAARDAGCIGNAHVSRSVRWR